MSPQRRTSNAQAESITLVFDLIRRYAEQRGWIPIGWRVFEVGPWTVTVNGTGGRRKNVPPYHALIEHCAIIALILVHPFGGVVGGWSDAEALFIRDLEAALKPAASDRVMG